MMHDSFIKVCLALFLRAAPIFVTTDLLPLRGNKSVVTKNGPAVRGFLIKSIVNINERAVIMLEL